MNANVFQIVTLLMNLIPQLTGLAQQAIAAHNSNDQAQLDAILIQVQAASNALAPE